MSPLLFSVVVWAGIGLIIGRLTYAMVVRLRPARARGDLPVARILGLVGALIGGAVGWSMHGTINEIPASLLASPKPCLYIADSRLLPSSVVAGVRVS